MKFRLIAVLALACLIALPTFASSLAKPGKWQTTIQMEMPGMPMKMPAQTVVTCVTKEQADNAENLIPKSGDKRGGCTYNDVKVDGSTVSWKMTCEKSQATGTGSVTYSGDSYTGTMHMKVQDHDMSATYSGKFLGACDGSEQK
jgi:hypothetical protein